MRLRSPASEPQARSRKALRSAAGIAWAKNVCADLRPYSTGAVYLNFIGDEGHDRVVAGYGKDNYDRLARVKAEFDPGNVFRLNQNIRPA